MNSAITFSDKRPPFAEAMRAAREFCCAKHDPPLTYGEKLRVYRMVRATSTIILRCTFR